MRPIRERLAPMKAYVDLIDWNRERSATNWDSSLRSMDEVLREGIADLDFDGDWFLQTGQEHKEGWSRK